MKAIVGETCAGAWLQAVQHLLTCRNWEDYNLVLEVRCPMRRDRRIEDAMDVFLRRAGEQPLVTVAETIFPAAEYRRRGSAGVYEVYPNEIFPRIKPLLGWGSYAHRLVRRTGPNGVEVNPLKDCVEKMQAELRSRATRAACYELGLSDGSFDLPLYDSAADRKRRLGGPCLSHVSLKITRDRQLVLTALYRAHYYVERALGNLLGLARLQAFVCEQTALSPGPLACVSTLAKLDVKSPGWSKGQIRELVAAMAADRSPAGAPS